MASFSFRLFVVVTIQINDRLQGEKGSTDLCGLNFNIRYSYKNIRSDLLYHFNHGTKIAIIPAQILYVEKYETARLGNGIFLLYEANKMGNV